LRRNSIFYTIDASYLRLLLGICPWLWQQFLREPDLAHHCLEHALPCRFCDYKLLHASREAGKYLVIIPFSPLSNFSQK